MPRRTRIVATLGPVVRRLGPDLVLCSSALRTRQTLEALDLGADAEADTQDGLRLAWPDRWVHVRPSGTEPIVRVIAEAPTAADAHSLIARSRVPLDALARA